MKIDINKKYRTRDGREVIIHAVDGPDKSVPVVASIRNPGGWMAGKWRADGIGATESSSLIEVREPREGFVSVVTEATFERAYGLGDPVGTFVTHRPGDEEDGFEVIRVREIID
jgi:hypothetical protein